MTVMDELKDIGPSLSKMKREVPFTVPDGYFDNFQSRLNKTIRERDTQSSLKYRIWMSPYMAAAVMMFVVLAAGTMVYRINHRSTLDERFHMEISLAVERELYSISEETLMETLANDHPDDLLQKPSPDETIDYLLNEGLDEEDLNNPL
jgi:hypothetical protein